MVTVNPARMLGWQGSLGSIEPNRLADIAVVAGKTGDPYRHLIDATETDIRLVVIGGVARYGTPALLDKLSPVDEQFDVAGNPRAFHLDTHDPDPVLGPMSLGEAATALADALEHMPERAAAIGSAFGSTDLGLAANQAVDGAEADARWFLDLDQPPIAGLDPTIYQGMAPALLDVVIGAESFASLAVPLTLDSLATEGDDTYFDMLANLANLPEAIRSQLPGRYNEVPHAPTIGIGPTDDDESIAPLPLADLLTWKGDLTLGDRRLIVEQAIVLVEQIYVHLPMKRARYAVDPLQRLRLVQHRLQDGEETGRMGPESDFHEELVEIFTAPPRPAHALRPARAVPLAHGLPAVPRRGLHARRPAPLRRVQGRERGRARCHVPGRRRGHALERHADRTRDRAQRRAPGRRQHRRPDGARARRPDDPDARADGAARRGLGRGHLPDRDRRGARGPRPLDHLPAGRGVAVRRYR